VAGYLMIFFDPLVFFKVSFQLSFASMAGIVAVSGLDGYSKIKSIKKLPIFGELFLQTLFAQIATMPLIIFYFGRYNLLSPLINAAVLWTVPIIMVFSAVAGIVGFLRQVLVR
jgi:competence protein ComEC